MFPMAGSWRCRTRSTTASTASVPAAPWSSPALVRALRPSCSKRRAAGRAAEGRRVQQRGFTLLEAVVALVLIGTTGMALMAWINTGLETVARVQDASARGEALRNALEQMQTVNPLLEPNGGD